MESHGQTESFGLGCEPYSDPYSSAPSDIQSAALLPLSPLVNPLLQPEVVVVGRGVRRKERAQTQEWLDLGFDLGPGTDK